MSEIRNWRRQRNRALLELDLPWARRNLPYKAPFADGPPDDETLLAAMHKARYECVDLPAAARTESRAWLEVRGRSRHDGLPWPETPLP